MDEPEKHPNLWEELSEDIDTLLNVDGHGGHAPVRLFHFTDTDGLVGILTSKRLRASLATALSDASETTYAIRRLRSQLDADKIPLRHLRRDLLLELLSERAGIEGLVRDHRVYVVSFCGADEAIHWLHYGRSGTGVAIGFDGNALATNQFPIFPVIYDTEAQDLLLLSLIERVDRFIGEFGRLRGNADRTLFDKAMASTAVSYLKFAAPRMKDPAFRSENEWRLVSSETWISGEAEEPTRTTHFRSRMGRVVPYKEVAFESKAVGEIVLGASSPMEFNEQALAVLMESSLGVKVRVRRSRVHVRP